MASVPANPATAETITPTNAREGTDFTALLPHQPLSPDTIMAINPDTRPVTELYTLPVPELSTVTVPALTAPTICVRPFARDVPQSVRGLGPYRLQDGVRHIQALY